MDSLILFHNSKDNPNADITEADIWNSITKLRTPEDQIYKRVISGSEEKGNAKYADYIKQFYVIRMLNLLFPGWELQDCNFRYYPEVRTFILDGYLSVKYQKPETKEWITRRIYGVGSAYVQATKEGNEPVKPDDMAKSCRTEFLKNVAYMLGIGFDVYSREITEDHIIQLENKLQLYYKSDTLREIAKSFVKVDDFMEFFNSLPIDKQIIDAMEAIDNCIEGRREFLLDEFQKQRKSSATKWLEQYKKSKLYKGDVTNV